MTTKICSEARTLKELKEQAKVQKIRPCDIREGISINTNFY
jgi:hypothetical protein